MQVLFIVALIHITVEWSFVEYFFNRAGPEGFLVPCRNHGFRLQTGPVVTGTGTVIFYRYIFRLRTLWELILGNDPCSYMLITGDYIPLPCPVNILVQGLSCFLIPESHRVHANFISNKEVPVFFSKFKS